MGFDGFRGSDSAVAAVWKILELRVSYHFAVFAFFAVEHQDCALGEGLERNQVKPTQKDQIILWVHDGGHVECI